MRDATAFDGFPPEALELYAVLEDDNSRERWQVLKPVWERAVRDPLLDLLELLADEFDPAGGAKLFRPNRDVRFSADKSPYKTHQGAFVSTRGGSGYYVQVSADGLLAGGGFRSRGAEETASFRRAVDRPVPGARLEQLVAGLERSGFEIGGDAVKTSPRGYPADHPRMALLRHKELRATRTFGAPDWLATDRVLDEVRETWRSVRPLVDWCGEHLAAD